MIIGVTGYGATGASACMDLLKEFEDVQYYNPHIEFQILQQPDGIRDLRFNLIESRRRISINSTICRFVKCFNHNRSDRLSQPTNGRYKEISQAYIDSLIQVRWHGKSSYDPADLLSKFEGKRYRYINAIIRRIMWLFNPNAMWPPFRERYYSCISEEEFIEKTNKYLLRIFTASGFQLDKPIILEQLFCLEDPLEGSEYFYDDFRTIIVDRDPRDVYILVNCHFAGQLTSFMPNTGNAVDFVSYYRGLHRSKRIHEKVYYLQFEDLIYNYGNTVDKMQNFLDLKHVKPRSHFKPEWSINNTKTYEQYPELRDEIAYIEENLKEYLYPFEKYENAIAFKPENTGFFVDKPGDKKKLIQRSERAFRKNMKAKH